MAGKTGGDLERLRAEFAERASGLKAEVEGIEKLPIMSRMTAGVGAAIKGLHLMADFILHLAAQPPANAATAKLPQVEAKGEADQ